MERYSNKNSLFLMDVFTFILEFEKGEALIKNAENSRMLKLKSNFLDIILGFKNVISFRLRVSVTVFFRIGYKNI